MSRLISVLFAVLIFSGMISAQEGKIYLTLNDAIARALQKNNQLRASHFATKQAAWDQKNAWTQLLPSIQFNTRYTWIDDSTFALRDFSRYFQGPNSPFDIPQTVFQKSWYSSIDVNMPLFNGNLLNGLFIAAENKNVAKKNERSVRDNTIFQVVTAWLNVLQAEDVERLQKEYLGLSQRNLDKSERLFEAGKYSRSEFLRWKVEFQQQKSKWVSSQSQVRSAHAIITRLLGLEANEKIFTADTLGAELRSEVERLMAMTDRQMLEMIDLSDDQLISANAALEATRGNEEISKLVYHNAYAAYLPDVSLNYTYAWWENNTIALDDYSPKTLMINFSIPLFSGFRNYTKLKSSYYDYQRSREMMADQLQNTRLVLVETVNKLINFKTQRELSEINIEYTNMNYRVVAEQKERGLVSNIDFIDAKLNLQNAKLEDISNRYGFTGALVELYYLLGRLETLFPAGGE